MARPGDAAIGRGRPAFEDLAKIQHAPRRPPERPAAPVDRLHIGQRGMHGLPGPRASFFHRHRAEDGFRRRDHWQGPPHRPPRPTGKPSPDEPRSGPDSHPSPRRDTRPSRSRWRRVCAAPPPPPKKRPPRAARSSVKPGAVETRGQPERPGPCREDLYQVISPGLGGSTADTTTPSPSIAARETPGRDVERGALRGTGPWSVSRPSRGVARARPRACLASCAPPACAIWRHLDAPCGRGWWSEHHAAPIRAGQGGRPSPCGPGHRPVPIWLAWRALSPVQVS